MKKFKRILWWFFVSGEFPLEAEMEMSDYGSSLWFYFSVGPWPSYSWKPGGEGWDETGGEEPYLYGLSHPNLYVFIIWVLSYILFPQRARMKVSPIICRLFEHRIVNDGWATPDTGGEEFYCTRPGCSWGHTHIMY
jgi:hypothetical protein